MNVSIRAKDVLAGAIGRWELDDGPRGPLLLLQDDAQQELRLRDDHAQRIAMIRLRTMLLNERPRLGERLLARSLRLHVRGDLRRSSESNSRGGRGSIRTSLTLIRGGVSGRMRGKSGGVKW